MYHGSKRHPVRRAQLGEHAPEVGVHGMQRDPGAWPPFVSPSAPPLLLGTGQTVKTSRKASRVAPWMTTIAHKLVYASWCGVSGPSECPLPLLNCSQREAFTEALCRKDYLCAQDG